MTRSRHPRKIQQMLRHDYHVRGGLPNFRRRIEYAEDATVMFFGASQTALRGWADRTFAWLSEQFPTNRLHFANASQGGVGLLVARRFLETKVLPHPPDLLFLEFSPVSLGNPAPAVLALVEDLIRLCYERMPQTDVCYVHCCDRPILEERLMERDYPDQLAAIETVLDLYGVPSINLVEHILRKVVREELIYDRSHYVELLTRHSKEDLIGLPHFSVEGHPLVGFGDIICGELIAEALPEIMRADGAGTVKYPAALPPRLAACAADQTLEQLLHDFSDDSKRIVALGHATGHLTGLTRFTRLELLDLSGATLLDAPLQLPPLPSLCVLKLEQCGITGPLPDLSHLSRLHSFSFRGNMMSGAVPDFAGSPGLKVAVLGDNQFTAAPAAISLPRLTHLDLSSNRFTGLLPELAGSGKLESLMIEFSAFRGPLPDLRACPLKHLTAHACRFDSYVPGSFIIPGLELLTLSSLPLPDRAVNQILTDLCLTADLPECLPKRVVIGDLGISEDNKQVAYLRSRHWSIEL